MFPATGYLKLQVPNYQKQNPFITAASGFLTADISLTQAPILEYILSWNATFCSPHASAMFSILLPVIIVYAISYAFWKLLPRFFVKSELDNLPGPPSQSFLFGKILWILGPRNQCLYSVFRCFSTIFQHPWMAISQRYCTEMYEYLFSYHLGIGRWRPADGSVIKIKAFLGVCAFLFRSFEVVLIAAL